MLMRTRAANRKRGEKVFGSSNIVNRWVGYWSEFMLQLSFPDTIFKSSTPSSSARSAFGRSVDDVTVGSGAH